MASNDLASFRFRTVFISDTHLGSGKSASAYLYEFLKNIDYKELKDIYIAGDFIGGWEHENGRQQALPEIEKRVLDILNYAADHGVKIHYIPGNHDEKVRPLIQQLQKCDDFSVFHKNFSFEREGVFKQKARDKKRFRQARFIHDLWQPRDRKKQLATYEKALNDIKIYEKDGERLREIFAELSAKGTINDNARKTMKHLVEGNKRRAATPQKRGLKAVFNKYAADQKLEKQDTVFAATVLQEMMTLCERKIEEKAATLNRAAQALNFEPYARKFG